MLYAPTNEKAMVADERGLIPTTYSPKPYKGKPPRKVVSKTGDDDMDDDDYCCDDMKDLVLHGDGIGSLHPSCAMWSFCPYCGDYC